MRTRNTFCPFCSEPEFSIVEISREYTEDLVIFVNVVCLGCDKTYDITLCPYSVLPSSYDESVKRGNIPIRNVAENKKPQRRLYLVPK
jgi:hypothetical protein